MSKKEFEKSLLAAHNKYRADHGAPALTWNQECADRAQEWADHLLSINSLEHGNHDGFGQNCAMSGGRPCTGESATDMWYEEINDYDFSNPGFNGSTGHFTQVVWKDTTSVGAAVATDGSSWYVVANYHPPGNFNNDYANQVLPKGTKAPKGKAAAAAPAPSSSKSGSKGAAKKTKRLTPAEEIAKLEKMGVDKWTVADYSKDGVPDAIKFSQKVRWVFLITDKDGSGEIDAIEFIMAMRLMMGDDWSDDFIPSLPEIFKAFDTTGNGTIDMHEWAVACGAAMAELTPEEEVAEGSEAPEEDDE